MKSTLQPTVGQLQNMKIFIRYLVADIPPKEGYKRMTYYTELYERPGKIYFGLSFRMAEDNESLKQMLSNGQIIELVKPELLPYEKDVWINELGEVFLLKGYAPWEEKDPKPFAKPKELDPAWSLINKISTKPIPYHELTIQ